ncbi:MAG: hypothetical protein SFZ23_02835 [Planctomycetota bacterium]|nr:hypothetical protein [Planctomycetota bacterium]
MSSKIDLSIAALSVLAVTSFGQDLVHMRTEYVSEGVLRLVPDESLTPQRGPDEVLAYQSLNSGSTNRLRVGSDEIGDDLYMVPGTGGQVSTIARTLVNMSATGRIDQYRMSLIWRDLATQGVQQRRDFVILSSLPPGVGAVITIPSIILDPLSIIVPDNAYFSVRYSDPIGIDPSDFGVLTGGPNIAGSSSRFIQNFTTGQQIDLGSEDNNIAYVIATRPIPAPGSALGLASLAGVLAARRRRA